MKRDLALGGTKLPTWRASKRARGDMSHPVYILKEALECSNIFFISLSIACAPVFTQKCVVCATSLQKVSRDVTTFTVRRGKFVQINSIIKLQLNWPLLSIQLYLRCLPFEMEAVQIRTCG